MLNNISDRLGLVALLSQRHEQLRGDPPAGSIAATEYERLGGVHAYHHALGRLSNVNEHLIALAALVRDAKVLPAFAAMTLLRISYEAALVARWVLDGSSDERLARGLRLHYDDLVERNKFENSIRPRGTELDDLATDGTEDDEVHRNEGWFYRFLSAYAHGKQWVQTLGLTDPVSDAASGPFCLPAGANDLRFPQVRSL